MKQVIVLGSVNIDEVYKVPHIVRPGETITSTSREEIAGGKGANCCVACGRAGAKTFFYAKIGDDAAWIKELITGSGSDTVNMKELEGEKTGRAIIQVEQDGENSIFLFPGANYLHNHADSLATMKSNGVGVGDYVVLQNEVNNITHFISLARTFLHAVIVWNPAPMPASVDSAFFEALCGVDILVVNETELISLAKLATLFANAEPQVTTAIATLAEADDYNNLLPHISAMFGIRLIVVTKGSAGVSAYSPLLQPSSPNGSGGDRPATIDVGIAPIHPSKVVDTTAAGDTWIGYFIAEIAKSSLYKMFSKGETETIIDSPPDFSGAENIIINAMKKACYASGISVTRSGAMPSIPLSSEVEKFLSTNTL